VSFDVLLRVSGGELFTNTVYGPGSRVCGIVTWQKPMVSGTPATLKLICFCAWLNLNVEIVFQFFMESL